MHLPEKELFRAHAKAGAVGGAGVLCWNQAQSVLQPWETRDLLGLRGVGYLSARADAYSHDTYRFN